jgi:hypothetical protein
VPSSGPSRRPSAANFSWLHASLELAVPPTHFACGTSTWTQPWRW